MPPPSATQHLPPSHPAARQRPKSPSRVLKEAEAQWLFNEAELANTPSIQDGMTPQQEKDLRAKGINFILQVGILLKLPQLTLSTAAIFFQRYHMRASFKSAKNGIPKLHHFQSAGIALFIAMKVEESCRKMKETIVACCRVAQKNPNLLVDEQSADYWKWKDCILNHEDVLLEQLCFDLTVDSPHRQLFNLLKYYRIEHNKKLRNAAWAFVTDAANTTLCLLCTSRTIAVAALYNACKYSDVQLQDDHNGRPWWDCHRVQLSDVSKAVEFMAVNIEDAGGAAKGNAPAGGPGAPASDGGRSIYVGMGNTPIGDNAGNDADVTRRRDGTKSSSPFSGSQSQILAPRSERRASNSSSVGQKRDRDDFDQPPTNGISTNGNGEHSQETKRPKFETNGDSQPNATAPPLNHATPNQSLHREEAIRVEHANKESEQQAHAASAELQQENGEGSEEGEVEE